MFLIVWLERNGTFDNIREEGAGIKVCFLFFVIYKLLCCNSYMLVAVNCSATYMPSVAVRFGLFKTLCRFRFYSFLLIFFFQRNTILLKPLNV